MIQEVHDLLTAAGASITDFHQFSNLSVCLTFEAEEHLATRVAEALLSSGLQIPESSLLELRHAAVAAYRGGMIEGGLQITFIHHEPDLRIPIPAVPG